jgi:hypothetical protein
MKNVRIKIGILLLLNLCLVFLWDLAPRTIFDNRSINNLVLPGLMLLLSIIALVIFTLIEFFKKNKNVDKMPKQANKKIILTVLIHALLTSITLFAVCFVIIASGCYLDNMLRPRLLRFPMLVFFIDVCFFIKSYFFVLLPIYGLILFGDYSLCRYLMKRIGERFIAWSHFTVAVVSMILMILVLLSSGDYMWHKVKEHKQQDEYWSKNQAQFWLYQNSVKFKFKELTIKEVFSLLNDETLSILKINLHAPEKVQAIKISFKPNGDDSHIRLNLALAVIKTKIEKLTEMHVYWKFKGNQIDFYCIEKGE